jgi:hypothetical protein
MCAGIRISLSSDIQRDGAGGICGDHVNVRHRNEDGDKCVWGQYTWVFPTAYTMPQRARPRKWMTCEPGLNHSPHPLPRLTMCSAIHLSPVHGSCSEQGLYFLKYKREFRSLVGTNQHFRWTYFNQIPSTLQMEAGISSVTPVSTYKTTWCHEKSQPWQSLALNRNGCMVNAIHYLSEDGTALPTTGPQLTWNKINQMSHRVVEIIQTASHNYFPHKCL